MDLGSRIWNKFNWIYTNAQLPLYWRHMNQSERSPHQNLAGPRSSDLEHRHERPQSHTAAAKWELPSAQQHTFKWIGVALWLVCNQQLWTCMYSGTPLVRPPLLHQKSGLSRGWPLVRGRINTFMFRFILSRGLSSGGCLSSGWPLKRGSTVSQCNCDLWSGIKPGK